MATPRKDPAELLKRGRKPKDPTGQRMTSATVRITAGERAALVERYGNTTRGLRAGIEAILYGVPAKGV
jgi:hypothetical protein